MIMARSFSVSHGILAALQSSVRAIETKSFYRVGGGVQSSVDDCCGDEPRPAVNRLTTARFADLLYRVSGFQINLPLARRPRHRTACAILNNSTGKITKLRPKL